VSSVRDIPMPKLSDAMEEATVLQWLKRPGDAVARGEPLVEVETDKATIVYEAEADGVLAEILVEEGGSAALGETIARLEVGAGAPAAAPVPAPAPVVAAAAPPQERPAAAPAKGVRAKATPVARRLAAQLGVALDGLAGTGPGGRIVAADVRTAQPANGQPAPVGDGDGRGPTTVVEHTPTQRTIAARMAESRSTIPEFTLEAEIAMDEAVHLREELRALGREPLPSYNDLVLRAVALALRDFPSLNASYESGRTLRHGRINVGLAVDTGDALLVPVVHDADRLSVLEIAREARRLAEGARDRKLAPHDLADGTFTVSNLGMLGVRRFHAVINIPQAAILAVGELALRAVVSADGAIVERTTMEVALSVDHRVVYGAEAARFLQRLRQLLEHPVALIMEEEG
jgi:pyruvate dehydrogenase E2 component (dihydrolipoyllysine-residue acetyltransferase)